MNRFSVLLKITKHKLRMEVFYFQKRQSNKAKKIPHTVFEKKQMEQATSAKGNSRNLDQQKLTTVISRK